MNEPALERYLRAGYAYLLTYEVWLFVGHSWERTRTPIRADDIDAHLHALQIRAHYGNVRGLVVLRIEDRRECPELVPEGFQAPLHNCPADQQGSLISPALTGIPQP